MVYDIIMKGNSGIKKTSTKSIIGMNCIDCIVIIHLLIKLLSILEMSNLNAVKRKEKVNQNQNCVFQQVLYYSFNTKVILMKNSIPITKCVNVEKK